MSSNNDLLDVIKSFSEGAGKESVNQLGKLSHVLFPFLGTKRKAVEAYIEEITNSNLSAELKMYLIANTKKTFKQLMNQKRIAEIAIDNAKEGTDFSVNSKVSEEWIDRFFESAKFVSDDEIQLLWGKLLSCEFEEPNSTSLSVVRILSEITPQYAKIFSKICNMKVNLFFENPSKQIAEATTAILVPVENKYNTFLTKNKIGYSTLSELETLGLLHFRSLTGITLTYNRDEYPAVQVAYNSSVKRAIGYPNNAFPMGNVYLTESGMCIQRIINNEKIPDFDKIVFDYLESNRVVFSKDSTQ